VVSEGVWVWGCGRVFVRGVGCVAVWVSE